jgi:two-component system sensor histidine kinase MprB
VSFRARLTLVATAAVAVAVLLASGVTFVLVRGQLREQVDESLRELASQVKVDRRLSLFPVVRLPEARFGRAGGFAEAVIAVGHHPRRKLLAVTDRDRAIAAGRAGPAFRDDQVGTVHVRVYTFPVLANVAVQVARSLEEVDDALGRLGIVLGTVSVGGVLAAAAVGFVVTRAALRPVRRVTLIAEDVTRTGDLTQRIEVEGDDELARLARSFNAMLGALDASLRSQRQLAADASHELRTPLTSLRTNIEVLASRKRMPAADRSRLMADVVGQVQELTTLVGDLAELARDGETEAEPQDVRLDEVTGSAVAAARRNAQGMAIEAVLEPTVVRGVAKDLERAVANLLDNAVKWSPPGGTVEVRVADGALTVRDHGPGIAEEDLPHVFDRFYRAPAARGMPGSGLGLAIVRRIAERHGGTVTAGNADGEGAVFTLQPPPGGAG